MAIQTKMRPSPNTCGRCLRTALRQQPHGPPNRRTTIRAHSDSSRAPRNPRPGAPEHEKPVDEPSTAPDAPEPAPKQGPMARRLEEATEEALLGGGRAGRRAVQDAGFSEELKKRLLDKLADAKFREENGPALRSAGLAGGGGGHQQQQQAIPEAADRGTRDAASARPWTGEEPRDDAVLRMLDDARRPLAPGLRGRPGTPAPGGAPVVDMRLRRRPAATGARRVADARDRVSVYAGFGLKDRERERGLSGEEREAYHKELRERFAPAARALPGSVTGLAALANERIEDAIARGQFKNIPRGAGVERDGRADNPFIDTTEYIMNKMIKRQEIVPPWIEKQQELVKAANVFRGRLRNDWKRHAARMIASRGGSLEEQMSRATEYARAEEVHNPRRRRNVDSMAVPTTSTEDVVMVALRQQALPEPSLDVSTPVTPASPSSDPQNTLTGPYRDADWEKAERSYMELAVTNLNALTRSYNLMAPELAKKPYFSLERELKACFADIAPQLADTIKERARRPEKSSLNAGGHKPGSILDRFAMESRSAKVYDSKTPHYGLKEMWRDFWQRSPS